jgi:hypothetical protein
MQMIFKKGTKIIQWRNDQLFNKLLKNGQSHAKE